MDCLQARLTKHHGNTVVTLSSSNTFSHGRKSVPLREYLGSMSSDAQQSSAAHRAPANESFYLFGPHASLSPKLSSLVETYVPPPFSGDDLAFSFGIGGPGTGIPFHIHGHGFSEVIHGGKVCSPGGTHAAAEAVQIDCIRTSHLAIFEYPCVPHWSEGGVAVSHVIATCPHATFSLWLVSQRLSSVVASATVRSTVPALPTMRVQRLHESKSKLHWQSLHRVCSRNPFLSVRLYTTLLRLPFCPR